MAYALIVEEYRRLGVDMLSAIEKTNESIGMGVGTAAPAAALAGAGEEPVPTAADNDRALAELRQLMGGAVPQ